MNTTLKRAAAIALAGLLSGCALNDMDASQRLNETHPIRCASTVECDRVWGRLQKGGDELTAHKFQERTPTKLRQYPPVFESVYPFILLATRVNAEDGSAVIKLETGCMNPFGCFPKAEALAMQLREYMARSD